MIMSLIGGEDSRLRLKVGPDRVRFLVSIEFESGKSRLVVNGFWGLDEPFLTIHRLIHNLLIDVSTICSIVDQWTSHNWHNSARV